MGKPPAPQRSDVTVAGSRTLRNSGGVGEYSMASDSASVVGTTVQNGDNVQLGLHSGATNMGAPVLEPMPAGQGKMKVLWILPENAKLTMVKLRRAGEQNWYGGGSAVAAPKFETVASGLEEGVEYEAVVTFLIGGKWSADSAVSKPMCIGDKLLPAVPKAPQDLALNVSAQMSGEAEEPARNVAKAVLRQLWSAAAESGRPVEAEEPARNVAKAVLRQLWSAAAESGRPVEAALVTRIDAKEALRRILSAAVDDGRLLQAVRPLGNDVKASCEERQARAATTIQRFARRLQARNDVGEKLTFAFVASIVLDRCRSWKEVFNVAANGELYMNAESFATGLRQVHPHFSKRQATALYHGFENLTELEHMELKVFRWFMEAGYIGDDAMTIYADIPLTGFQALRFNEGIADGHAQGHHREHHVLPTSRSFIDEAQFATEDRWIIPKRENLLSIFCPTIVRVKLRSPSVSEAYLSDIQDNVIRQVLRDSFGLGMTMACWQDELPHAVSDGRVIRVAITGQLPEHLHPSYTIMAAGIEAMVLDCRETCDWASAISELDGVRAKAEDFDALVFELPRLWVVPNRYYYITNTVPLFPASPLMTFLTLFGKLLSAEILPGRRRHHRESEQIIKVVVQFEQRASLAQCFAALYDRCLQYPFSKKNLVFSNCRLVRKEAFAVEEANDPRIDLPLRERVLFEREQYEDGLRHRFLQSVLRSWQKQVKC